MNNQLRVPSPETAQRLLANLRRSRLALETATLELEEITLQLEKDTRQKRLQRLQQQLTIS